MISWETITPTVYPGTCEMCRHSPPWQFRLMYGSPKIWSIKSFIAGSSNRQPDLPLQLNVAGPLMDSVRKSSRSAPRQR